MDHATASKYRVILFGDQEDTNPLPPGLVKLHNFAHQRLQRFGMGGVSREVALSVVMQWMQTTDEGRAFYADPATEPAEAASTQRPRSRLTKEPAMTAPV